MANSRTTRYLIVEKKKSSTSFNFPKVHVPLRPIILHSLRLSKYEIQFAFITALERAFAFLPVVFMFVFLKWQCKESSVFEWFDKEKSLKSVGKMCDSWFRVKHDHMMVKFALWTIRCVFWNYFKRFFKIFLSEI